MATQPDFIPQAFAESGDRNEIPNTSTSAASWLLGFPPITSLPLGAGGVAPDRKDFNAIFYEISAHAVYSQAGGVYAYSAEIAYDPPSIVYDNDDGKLYYCIASNGPNGVAPHEDTTGTYWQSVSWGNITWLNEGTPNRSGDNAITLAGDRTADFPRGKLLRFNGDDAYLCRVYGDPVLTSNMTVINVWFDTATVIPPVVTAFERSRLSPIDTARGVALVTSTDYTDIQLTELLLSHCYSSVIINQKDESSDSGTVVIAGLNEAGALAKVSLSSSAQSIIATSILIEDGLTSSTYDGIETLLDGDTSSNVDDAEELHDGQNAFMAKWYESWI